MSLLERVHARHVHGRRVRVLAAHLAECLPAHATVLDVGAGDGALARAILERRPDVRIVGIDVRVRAGTSIDVRPFDGRVIPYPDDAFDAVMVVDVLHHTTDPTVLLREAARTARSAVVVKDHLAEGWLARATLAFMDRVGNARHGVPLPYTYWRRAEWHRAFRDAGLAVEEWRERLGLYPPVASALFDRTLHVVARLRPL